MPATDLDNLFGSLVTPSDLREPCTLELPGQVEPDFNSMDDRTIVTFFRRYSYWLLYFSRTLAHGYLLEPLSKEQRDRIVINSGYSVLLLLNPLIDLIGLLVGNDTDYKDFLERLNAKGARSWNAWEETWKRENLPSNTKTVYVGLDYFIASELDGAPYNVYKTYLESVRHGVAHTSFPKQRIIIHHHLQESGYLSPLLWGPHSRGNPTLAINIPSWQSRIENRFFEYVSAIRYPRENPVHQKWRDKFVLRIDHIPTIT